MDHHDLHPHLDAIAARVLPFGADPLGASSGADAELDEVNAHAASGCTPCARALVNAREVAVDLALAQPVARPSGDLAARVLGSARRARVTAPPAVPDAKSTRVLDASMTIAHLHIGAPGDAERTREGDELAAATPTDDDATPRVLAQVGRIIGFPLLFVSVVRGERVGYRVQLGLDPAEAHWRDLRREVTYCTHCVSSGEPFIVQNAGTEPFFRGSKMVTRHRVYAYAGVPIRTSRGIILGTLCALDYAPHAMGPEVVRTLRHFSRVVLAEVERPRLPALREALIEPVSAKIALYREAWFTELLDVELDHVRRGRASTLVCARGPGAAALATLARDDEPVGRLADDAVGLLLTGTGVQDAGERVAALRSGLAASGLASCELTITPAAPDFTGAAWRARALGNT